MKNRKKLFRLLGTLCVVTLFASLAAACGGNENPGGEDPVTYSVSVTASEDYTLTPSADSAKEGDTVTVTAAVTDEDKYLTGVTYNGTACSETDSGYSFVMPAADVTLAATLGDYEEVLSDGGSGSSAFVMFASSNSKTIAKTESGNATLSLVFNGSYMTSLKSTFASSDPDVIPVDAIAVNEKYASMSTVINGADLLIDVSKINLGSTWLTMSFTNGNASSQKGTIVVKITVSETVTLEKWTETLVFDLRNIDEDATYHVHLYDMDYITGSDGKKYQGFDDLTATDGKVTVQIEYVVGHSYSLEFAIVGSDGKLTYYDLTETVGTGSSVTGYNQYDDGRLSFVDDGASLQIIVLSTTHT